MGAGDDNINVKIGATTGELKTGMDEAAAKVGQATGIIQTDFTALQQTVTAQTDRVVEALKKTGDEAKNTASQSKGSFDTIGESISKLGVLAAGVTAVVGGGMWLKGLVSETMEWTSTALKLSKALGITTEEASALNLALGELAASSLRSDITAQTLTHSLQMFVRQLATNEETLNSYGITTREANGEFRNSLDIFLDALSYLRNIDGATAQNVRGTEIFKRSWGEVRPLLGLTEEALDRAKNKVKELGVEVSGKNVEGAKEFSKATHELSLEWDAFSTRIGTKIIPSLTALMEALRTCTGWITSSLDVLGAWNRAAGATQKVLADMGLVKGPSGGTTGEWSGTPRKSGGGADIDVSGKGGKGGGGGTGPGLLQEWKSELEQLKVEENAFLDFSKQREKQFWQDKLDQCQEGSKEYLAVRHEMYALDKALAQEAFQTKMMEMDKEIARDKTNWDQKKALMVQEVNLAKTSYGEQSKEHQKALEKQKDLDKAYEKYEDDLTVSRLNNALKVSQMEVEGKRASLQYQREMGLISAKQESQALIALKQFELQLEQQTITKKRQIRQGDEKAMEQLDQQEAQFKQKKLNEMTKAEQDAALKNKQTIQSFLAPIQSAIDTSVMGIIQGTTTISKAINNLMMSILSSFIGVGAKIVETWIANQAEMLIFGEGSAKEGATAKVSASAAEAGAAGFASVMMELPWPANMAVAPEVGMAAATGALSFLSLASVAGGWDIPADSLAYVHKKEMILPAGLAERIRNMTAPGGAGGGTTIHAPINFAPTYNYRPTQADMDRDAAMMIRALNKKLSPRGQQLGDGRY